MKPIIIAAGLAVVASGSSAATFFTDFVTFASASSGLPGVIEESFEDDAYHQYQDDPTMFTSWGNITETSPNPLGNAIRLHDDTNTNPSDFEEITHGTTFGALYGTVEPVVSGDHAAYFHDNGAQNIVTWTFDSAIDAYGVWLTSTGDSMFNISSTSGSDPWSLTIALTSTPTFFGVLAEDVFTDIVFDFVGSPPMRLAWDDAVFADTSYIAPVPLPASGLMLLAGLGLIGASRRKS